MKEPFITQCGLLILVHLVSHVLTPTGKADLKRVRQIAGLGGRRGEGIHSILCLVVVPCYSADS